MLLFVVGIDDFLEEGQILLISYLVMGMSLMSIWKRSSHQGRAGRFACGPHL